MNHQHARFAAGCFWGVEAAFRKLKGVVATRVGYAGGTTPNPSYKDVCRGNTGHAETVEVEYNPARVSYEELLKLFWSIHDPTTPDRAGPDVGTQYRSVIFYFTMEQKHTAELSKQREAARHRQPIVTEIVAAGPFYIAEDYHQCYLEKKHGKS